MTATPEHLGHWFYQEYILKKDKIGALHVKFNEADNPSMTRENWSRIVRETPEGALKRRRHSR